MSRDVNESSDAPPQRRRRSSRLGGTLVLAAALGAVAGWSATSPVYRAEAAIAPAGAPGLGFIESTGGCVLYDEFPPPAGPHAELELQKIAILVRHSRTLGDAAEGAASAGVTRAEVEAGLRTRVDRNQGCVEVSFESRDAAAAASVLSVVLDAALARLGNETDLRPEKLRTVIAQLQQRLVVAPDDVEILDRLRAAEAALAATELTPSRRSRPTTVKAPTVPTSPVRDDRHLLAAIGAAVGLVFGAAASLARGQQPSPR